MKIFTARTFYRQGAKNAKKSKNVNLQ